MRLQISIDRDSKSWAVFKDWNVVHNFTHYETETEALMDAMEYCRKHGDANPSVVYPRITAMRKSYR